MFSSRTLVPVRRALQAALQINVPTSAPTATLLRHKRAGQQQRQYAMRSPRVIRMEKNKKTKPAESKPKPGFSETKPSALQSWQEYASIYGLGDLTPEICFNTTKMYLSAYRNGLLTDKALQKNGLDIDCYVLHCTATGLFNQSHFELGYHMLYTASKLGYTPSTISIINLQAGATVPLVAEQTQRRRELEARFKQLLKTDRSPDVLTVQGRRFITEGRDTLALNYFHEAIETSRYQEAVEAAARSPSAQDHPKPNPPSSPAVRKPKWTYEGTCHHHRGLVYLKQGKQDAAIEAFSILALELNLAAGYLELAKLLPQDAPERETYLLKAVQAGQFEAAGLLALIEMDKSMQPGMAPAVRMDAIAMALEWAMIEPDEDKREKLLARLEEEKNKMVLGKRTTGS